MAGLRTLAAGLPPGPCRRPEASPLRTEQHPGRPRVPRPEAIPATQMGTGTLPCHAVYRRLFSVTTCKKLQARSPGSKALICPHLTQASVHVVAVAPCILVARELPPLAWNFLALFCSGTEETDGTTGQEKTLYGTLFIPIMIFFHQTGQV